MAIIANFTTVRENMGGTRTAKDFYRLLGSHAENLGILSKLYEQHTASYFTEAFGNVIYGGKASENKFQKLNNLLFEWEIWFSIGLPD